MALRGQPLGYDGLAIVSRARVAHGLTVAALAVDAFLGVPEAGPMAQRAYARLGRVAAGRVGWDSMIDQEAPAFPGGTPRPTMRTVWRWVAAAWGIRMPHATPVEAELLALNVARVRRVGGCKHSAAGPDTVDVGLEVR
jgi:hypothetical protein